MPITDELEGCTFDRAMALKPDRDEAAGVDLTDAQWYVVMVAHCCAVYDGLSPGAFMFSIRPPNPEIEAFFKRRVAPHLCAIQLFQTKH